VKEVLPLVLWQKIETHRFDHDLRQRFEDLRAGLLKLNEKGAEEKKTPFLVVDLIPYFFDPMRRRLIGSKLYFQEMLRFQ
jgi:hypothetical protein